MMGEILSRARAPGRLRASAQPQQVCSVDPVARTEPIHRNNAANAVGMLLRQFIGTAVFLIIATGAYCVAPGASIRAVAQSTTIWTANLTPGGPMMIWEFAWNCDDLDIMVDGNMMPNPDIIPGDDNNHCYRRAYGYNKDGFDVDYGRLTDDEFSHDGVDYKVAWVFQDSRGIHFQLFALNLQDEYGIRAPTFQGIFEVAGTSYNFSDNSQIGRGFGMCGPGMRPDCQDIDYKWKVSGLDWSSRTSISLKIIATSGTNGNGGGGNGNGNGGGGNGNGGGGNSNGGGGNGNSNGGNGNGGSGNGGGGNVVPKDSDAENTVPAKVTVSFGLPDYTVAEGETATVSVFLNTDPKRSLSIPISTTNLGGASNADYTGVPSSLTFASGEIKKTFTFTAVDDTENDDGERVELGFEGLPTGVSPGNTPTATVSIADNDDPPGLSGAFPRTQLLDWFNRATAVETVNALGDRFREAPRGPPMAFG